MNINSPTRREEINVFRFLHICVVLVVFGCTRFTDICNMSHASSVWFSSCEPSQLRITGASFISIEPNRILLQKKHHDVEPRKSETAENRLQQGVCMPYLLIQTPVSVVDLRVFNRTHFTEWQSCSFMLFSLSINSAVSSGESKT